jgi:hypothetical protein
MVDGRLAYIDSETLDVRQSRNAGGGAANGSLSATALYVGRLAGDGRFQTDLAIGNETVLRYVDADIRPQAIVLQQVLPHPVNSSVVFLLSGAPNSYSAMLLRYELLSDTVDTLARWQDNGPQAMPLSASPDGRFLALLRYTSWRAYVTIVDVDGAGRMTVPITGRPFGRFAWSPDGEWLAIADDRMLWLVAPGHDYRRSYAHDGTGCQAVTWLAS